MYATDQEQETSWKAKGPSNLYKLLTAGAAPLEEAAGFIPYTITSQEAPMTLPFHHTIQEI